ncbi:hypothetical protein BV923_21345 [Pectobacterium odoriferum]|uniref:hypothetical protein n=1 Tax=Pectobacterium odoriferum TaxID=78398 RepID=UPI000CD18572|nr:hypothetical protein [Pectobacterium odoriferum]POE18467.1 hypothetical protein BV923_21345 [Pectobacterium odoriferum]
MRDNLIFILSEIIVFLFLGVVVTKRWRDKELSFDRDLINTYIVFLKVAVVAVSALFIFHLTKKILEAVI